MEPREDVSVLDWVRAWRLLLWAWRREVRGFLWALGVDLGMGVLWGVTMLFLCLVGVTVWVWFLEGCRGDDDAGL